MSCFVDDHFGMIRFGFGFMKKACSLFPGLIYYQRRISSNVVIFLRFKNNYMAFYWSYKLFLSDRLPTSMLNITV